ncbi:MAG: putative DNA-binding domain-containing protein [Alphaproteobacteria bacterium]|nr:putative DNA-binding domain-containing protein [Alphaproteobacteria bacterium]
MKSLAAIQDAMAHSVREGDDAALPHLAKPARGGKAGALAVYQQAYLLRLGEFLAHDYEMLHSYVGDTEFIGLGRAYIAAHTSRSPNARWFSTHLPDFIARSERWRRNPEVAELAALERALNTAFDAADALPYTLAQLAAANPENFGEQVFAFHPSVQHLTFTQNTTSIWSALKCGEQPPAPHRLDEAQRILVWRQGASSRFRMIGAEESMALDCIAKGLNFALVCEMISVMDKADEAPQRAAAYLREWIGAGLLLAPEVRP